MNKKLYTSYKTQKTRLNAGFYFNLYFDLNRSKRCFRASL